MAKFKTEYVTGLVHKWREAFDDEVLTEIIEETSVMVESIASEYGQEWRDEQIQASYEKLLYAIPMFDPERGKLNTFFDRVIRNECNKAIKRLEKFPTLELDLEMAGEYKDRDLHDEYLRSVLIARNRVRFSSLPVEVVDHATSLVLNRLIDGIKRQDVVSDLVSYCDMERKQANVFYSSSLIYLRYIMMDECEIIIKNEEWTLMPDVLEVCGRPVYELLAKLMTGIYLRFS